MLTILYSAALNQLPDRLFASNQRLAGRQNGGILCKDRGTACRVALLVGCSYRQVLVFDCFFTSMTSSTV
jgi:hypothetical protein